MSLILILVSIIHIDWISFTSLLARTYPLTNRWDTRIILLFSVVITLSDYNALFGERSQELGDNCSVVENDYLADNRMFGLLKGVNLWKSHHLNVFNDTVVGVATRLPYSIQAKVLNVNYIRFGVFVAGILLFLFARRLVRNAWNLYCSLGPRSIGRSHNDLVTAPIHKILAWIISRRKKLFPPKRRLLTMEEYQKEGQETTRRELERLRQYCRSPDADVWSITSKVRDPRRFARFIDGKEQHVLEEEEDLYESDAEYLDRDDDEEEDGQETTRRELERLRQYCRSPDADVWSITSKVRDPRRFARFIDGKEQHVLEEEEDLYESDAEYLDRDDDEEEDVEEGHDDGNKGNPTSREIYDEDGNEWEEEVIIRRTPRSRPENYVVMKNDDDEEEDVEEDYDDRIKRNSTSREIYDEDGNEWEEEVIVRRTPRSRPENYVVLKKSSSKRSNPFPQNGSRLATPQASSPYYRDSPRQNSARFVSPVSLNKRYQARRNREDLEYDSSFARNYKQRQELAKPVQG
ncbi:unnamed protein product [Strongylus vulgaris]|uniref:Uncharacterized protein n=1 Tax=Strongylus vulgaris TaxID=40348 RepID=A0A3P7JED4_STRVU|nr:unnamed protein product [Strongylus vulgaris]